MKHRPSSSSVPSGRKPAKASKQRAKPNPVSRREKPAKKACPASTRRARSVRNQTLPRVGEPGPKPYDWRPLFLKALRAEVGVVQRAADAAGIGRNTAYEAKAKDPQFAEDWLNAVAAGVDDLQGHALDMARGKMVKGVYFEGERVASEPVQFERTLHKFLAKHLPEWGERTELTGRDGKPLIPENMRSFDLETMTDEELLALRGRLDELDAAAH